MRIMGIDYGDSRIGVAVSDPLGWMAQGLETIQLKGNIKKALEKIVLIISQYGIDKIVVGFPKNMNGTIGPRGEKTLEFIGLLDEFVNMNHADASGQLSGQGGAPAANNTRIEIIKWDERLTSVAANRTMHELGVKTSKKKNLVDQIAAVYILQGYLDSIKK